MGIFPNAAAELRLVGAVLIDMHDEWIAGDRRQVSEESLALLNTSMDTRDHAAIEGGEWAPRITSKPANQRGSVRSGRCTDAGRSLVLPWKGPLSDTC